MYPPMTCQITKVFERLDLSYILHGYGFFPCVRSPATFMIVRFNDFFYRIGNIPVIFRHIFSSPAQ